MRSAIFFSTLCVLAVALPQDHNHDSHDHDSHDHDSHDHDSGVIEDVHESLIDDFTSATVTATAAVIEEIHYSLIDEFTMTADVAEVDRDSIIDEIHETMVENFTDDAAAATVTAVDAVAPTEGICPEGYELEDDHDHDHDDDDDDHDHGHDHDDAQCTPIASDTAATPPVQTTDGALKKAPMIGGVIAAALFAAKFI